MTEFKKDRPDLLPRRGPAPAPDEKVDPVDVSPAPTARPANTASTPISSYSAPPPMQILPPKAPAKRREATIPIGPRLSVSVVEILDQAMAEYGITQREALEQAIVARWGKTS
ncbi:hypothetical protein ACQCSX_22970 (plasmid) [Pseudarthrobacter sp. P1]|uniref:hypothetical protein n=1 Tax=Pseudarthrobacter sp. P1 TaxID=3418418 RepID=UPI003CF822E4